MKKILSAVFALVLSLSAVAVTASAADEYTYSIKEDGTVMLVKLQSLYVTDFTVPSAIDGRAVTEIAPQAFMSKTGLLNVTIPETVTAVGSRAFSGCINLKSVAFPSTPLSIGESCFDRCAALTDVYVNASAIGEYVFASCTALTYVSLGNTLTEIPENTFYGCTALKTVIFPAALTRICRSAFNKCEALEGVSFPSDVPFTIEKYAFLDCKALKAVTLTPNITVEEFAFAKRADNVYIHEISITCQKYSNAYMYCSKYGIEPVFAVYSTPSMQGDIDADGAVTTTDARITLRIAAQLEKNFTELTSFVDFDGDSKITTTDARRVLRKAASLE